jgi:hydrogenase maturation factor
MLAMPQMRSTSIKPSPNDPYSRIVTYEGSASPRELLENCVIQAGAALIGLNAVEKVSQQEAKTWKQKTKEEKARMTLSEAAKHEAEVQAEKDKDEDVQLRVFW